MTHALSFRHFREVLLHWFERVLRHETHGPNAHDEFDEFFNK